MNNHHPDSAAAQLDDDIRSEVFLITDIFMRILAGRSQVVALNVGLSLMATIAEAVPDQKKYIADSMKERADLIYMPTVTDVEIKETLQ